MSAPPDFVIRQAVPDDLEALLVLEQASFPGDRLSRRQYRHHLRNPGARVLVAAGPALAGAAVVLFRRGSRVARLYSLAVAATMRGHGIGARLLQAAEDAARERGCRVLRLEVRCDNAAATALYRRAGYRCIGTREGYYEDGADALCFEKSIRDNPDGEPRKTTGHESFS